MSERVGNSVGDVNRASLARSMSSNVKDEMRQLVDALPDECTWEEVMDRVDVRQQIAAGLSDVEAGRVIDHEDVFTELLNGVH